MALTRLRSLAATPSVVLRTVLALLAYAVSHLAPDRSGRWVFGADGGTRFVGNPKYAFLHVANERDDVRPIWISKESTVVEDLRAGGYEAYHARSVRGLGHTLLAEYLFVSHGPADVTWWATGGTDVVQLWHGAPIKRIGDDLDRDWSLAGRFFFRLTGSNWAKLITNGEAVNPIFARAYHQADADVLALGYPRNDVFRGAVPDAVLGMESTVDRVRSMAADGPVGLYLPTWRSWNDSVGHGDERLDAVVDFETLDERLAAADAHLLVKLHPHERLSVDLDRLDRVVELPAASDPYPLLAHVDVLATDYSSIAIDFLLADRPIVFFPFDRARYARNPGFALDYDAVTAGPTPTAFEPFADELIATLDGRDDFAAEREAVRAEYIDHPDGSAGERLYKELRRR